MECPLGMHCVTGPSAWWFTAEEPPSALGWFTGSFSIVLYTRSPTATIAAVLIAQVAYELLHTFWALFTMDLGGGPLPPESAGLLGILFRPHPHPEILFMMYPMFSIFGAVLGYIIVVGWGTPIFLESYFDPSTRAKRVGVATWLWRQVGYTLQLALITYLPNMITFGVITTVIGADERVALLFIWIGCNLLLILTFWWWNQNGLDVVWTERNGFSPRQRHDRFYSVWALAFVAFWLPVIVLLPAQLPSHVRALAGVLLVFLGTLRHMPVFLSSHIREGESPPS